MSKEERKIWDSFRGIGLHFWEATMSLLRLASSSSFQTRKLELLGAMNPVVLFIHLLRQCSVHHQGGAVSRFFSCTDHFSPHIHGQEGEGDVQEWSNEKEGAHLWGGKSLTLGWSELQVVLHGHVLERFLMREKSDARISCASSCASTNPQGLKWEPKERAASTRASLKSDDQTFSLLHAVPHLHPRIRLFLWRGSMKHHLKHRKSEHQTGTHRCVPHTSAPSFLRNHSFSCPSPSWLCMYGLCDSLYSSWRYLFRLLVPGGS